MNEKISATPSPRILEGKTLRSLLLSKMQSRISKIQSINPLFRPKLSILLVGENPSSLVYVHQKKLLGEKIGIQVDLYHFPATSSLQQLLEKISELNDDPSVHGILTQLPIPDSLSLSQIAQAIDPKKDVDGIHPLNMGQLFGYGNCLFVPATPLGILKILSHYEIQTKGQNVVILNRSTIVGKPLACLLGSKNSYGNATVTLCHSHTKNLQQYTEMADILVTATSIPHLVTESMLKTGCVVIDLGQAVELRNGKRHITGDMKLESENSRVAAITPVPGGVGPLTVASLMENIFKSSLAHENIPSHIADYDFF